MIQNKDTTNEYLNVLNAIKDTITAKHYNPNEEQKRNVKSEFSHYLNLLKCKFGKEISKQFLIKDFMIDGENYHTAFQKVNRFMKSFDIKTEEYRDSKPSKTFEKNNFNELNKTYEFLII
jgi:hypothetical protein